MSVGPPVRAAMTEALTADATEVGLLSTVDPHMLVQGCPERRSIHMSHR